MTCAHTYAAPGAQIDLQAAGTVGHGSTQPASSTTTAAAKLPDSLPQLLKHLDDIRQARNQKCIRLLQELTPLLQAARWVAHELDRQLARRFNTFRYLRDDELGLSRIIADLLNPEEEHGQGTTYLEAMLDLLDIRIESCAIDGSCYAAMGLTSGAALPERLAGGPVSAATHRIRVELERWIPGNRRIDITVDIPTDTGRFCLAFENKPYADDQTGQCKDYLEYLDKEYPGRFLLVYMPPQFQLPDESSLPAASRERWKHHFRVLPYCANSFSRDDALASDGDDSAHAHPDSDYGAGYDDLAVQEEPAEGSGVSLADWFKACSHLSEAERMRWFLREAQFYCQHHFGIPPMTDTEAHYIREYLEKNPNYLPAAFAVARAWPDFAHDVCRRFLEQLTDRIKKQAPNKFPEKAGDLDIECQYGEDKSWASYLRLFRKSWVQYEGASDAKSSGRTVVMLECGEGGPVSWYWGVRSPKRKDQMNAPEMERRSRIEAALEKGNLSITESPHWPHWEKPYHGDWTTLIPRLHQEVSEGGGKVTDYYVKGFLNLAEKVIPSIDEVELVKPDSPG